MPNTRRFLGHPTLPHGNVDTYRAGCRCRRCSSTASRFADARRLDHLDGGHRVKRILAAQPTYRPAGIQSGIGSARRLRALVAVGYPPNQLAERLGMLTAEVLDLLYQPRRGTIHVWKAQNIAALYDELWDQPLMDDIGDQVRTVARREAWLPPLAWDDDDIDDRSARPACVAEAVPGDITYIPFSELEFLFDAGTPVPEILRRAGYSDIEGLKKRLHAHGRKDLLAKIPTQQRAYPNQRAGVPA